LAEEGALFLLLDLASIVIVFDYFIVYNFQFEFPFNVKFNATNEQKNSLKRKRAREKRDRREIGRSTVTRT